MSSAPLFLERAAGAAPAEPGLPARTARPMRRLRGLAAGLPAFVPPVSTRGDGAPWWTATVPARWGGFPAAAGESGTPRPRRPGGEQDVAGPADATPRPAILIIDDQVGAGDELVRLLELEGFAVECAASGTEGLARALARSWAAVLLDLHLPDIPGLKVLEQLTAAGLTCPVVAVTGWYLSEEYEQAARRLGAAAFQFKPLDAEDLARLLREATARRDIGPAKEHGGRGRPPDVAEATAAGLAGRPREEGGADAPGEERAADRLRLYDRLRAGDLAALDALAAALLPSLAERLRRRFPRIDEQLLNDAAEDALIDLAGRPERFDPERGVPLDDYLFGAAWRNAADRLRSEGRRRLREAEYARQQGDEFLRPEMDAAEAQHDLDAVLAVLGRAEASEAERQALRLLLEGERSSEVWAHVLGLSGLPPEARRRQVKRLKDRLLKRLRRWWRRRP